ncbi:Tetratricopeptide repeat-containing protein [Flavobacteriaceae bacterium MAR_2010_188]|nr:Tetratricopeptide repeat-containing protein [Flavobacteriaceae bacterium MAR_2010_188]
MKTRITLVFAALFLSFNMSFAQQDEESMTNLTIFTDYYKSKKYDEAYEPWMKVRTKSPKFNRAIYAYGETILKHKIDNSTGAEKKAYIEDLMKLYDESLQYYPSNYSVGSIAGDKLNIMYDNKDDLKTTPKQLFEAGDKGYKDDLQNFTNPRALYIYFSSMVDMHAAGQAEIQQVFDKYDDVSDKIETEVEKVTEDLNKLVEKEDAGTKLSSKEEGYKRQYESYLENYDKIGGSIDSKLGQLANCENLIPLYQKNFEQFKNDAVWLKRAVSRMYNKECTDDPLYTKMVKAYDETDPSADTKYFVATLLFKQNKDKEAQDYLNQSYDLQTDKFKKGKLAKRIANSLKGKGQFGAARRYYQEALKLNPSDGSPHLSIAGMYASSANSCGDSNFNKRAVFWLAAQEAAKAGRVDGNLKSASSQSVTSYNAKAPQRSEIFQEGNQGKTIQIGCWIGMSVTVPTL